MMFFYVFLKSSRRLGVAYAPPGFDKDVIPRDRRVEHWKVPELQLDDGEMMDFLGCDHIWHICSPKLRKAIEGASDRDLGIQWLPIIVVDRDFGRNDYFILHIPRIDDILDKGRTIYAAGGRVLVRPCLDRALLKESGRKLFKLRPSNVGLIVSEEIKDAIQTASCTGIRFSAVKQN